MVEEVVKETVSTYKKFCCTPAITGLEITTDCDNDDLLHWELSYSERNLVRKKNVAYKIFGSVNSKSFKVQKSPYNSETNEIITAYPKCSSMKASVVQVKNKDNFEQYIEVWQDDSKIMTFDLKAENVHGPVYNNPMFGCMTFSHDGTKILYIADNKPFKCTKEKYSFFDKNALDDSDEKINDSRRNKFAWDDNWGEQMYNCKEPTLCILDLKAKKITNLYQMMPKDISISRAFWSKDDNYIVFTGFLSSPWRLGLIYCRNRSSGIYAYKFSNNSLKTLVDCKDCIYSLNCTPDGSQFFYLQTHSLGPHSQCAKLMKITLSDSKSFTFGPPQVVYDYVKNPPAEGGFQGFFLREALVAKCWLNNHTIVFESQNRSHISLFQLDVDTGELNTLELEGEWRILGIKNQLLFASHALPNMPTSFKIGRIKKTNNNLSVEWILVQQFPHDLTDLKWSIMQHKPNLRNEKYPAVDFESVVVRPKEDNKVKGLLVFPHGGPHGCWSTGFDFQSACLARLGYIVLKVNYRGSTGFSQNGIYSLIGNIGTQDVQDTHQAALEAVKMFKVPPSKVFVKGGSHGGFLTLHLIAQYPDFYKAAVARNPVCNIVSNTCSSDIPDWSYSEAGLNFNHSVKPSEQDYVSMLRKSPVSIADRIKTPLMLMLGSVDKRVPHQQSIELYRLLKSGGVKVKLMMYPGCDHRIAELESETDSFINTVVWLRENSL